MTNIQITVSTSTLTGKVNQLTILVPYGDATRKYYVDSIYHDKGSDFINEMLNGCPREVSFNQASAKDVELTFIDIKTTQTIQNIRDFLKRKSPLIDYVNEFYADHIIEMCKDQ